MVLDFLTHLVEKISLIDGLVFAILSSILLTAHWYLSIPKNIPPGVYGLPIVGYLPFLGKKPYKTFVQLGKKHGNVFSVYMGSQLVIVLNDYEAIKEAFIKQGDVFSGRPDNMPLNAQPKDNLSISTTDGPFWRDHRRFALTTLRNLGIGKTSIEPRIMHEVQYFLSKLRTFDGKRKNIMDFLGLSVSNNICIMVFGKRFDYGNEFILRLKHTMDTFVSLASNVATRIFFPWMRYLPGTEVILHQQKFEQIFQTFGSIMEDVVKEKEKTYVEDSKADYVDAYLSQRKSVSTKENIFGDGALTHNMRMLLGAGTETTTNTLMFCISYMMRYPEVQQKCQDEIDDAIGTERMPSWSDRLRTPYIEATLLEIQRMISLAPLALAHSNLEEAYLFGHRIPKGSYIIPNLWNVHHDPKLWKSPEEFRPQRFLNQNGDVVRPEYLIPFSVGKRECLGRSLAVMELYLYFTAMLQQFTFKSPTAVPPSLDSTMGLILLPVNFEMCAIPRKCP